MEVGKTFSLVGIPVGSWERWETEPGFLGVWIILYVIWVAITARQFEALACPDSLCDFEQVTSMSYMLFKCPIYLVTCKIVMIIICILEMHLEVQNW